MKLREMSAVELKAYRAKITARFRERHPGYYKVGSPHYTGRPRTTIPITEQVVLSIGCPMMISCAWSGPIRTQVKGKSKMYNLMHEIIMFLENIQEMIAIDPSPASTDLDQIELALPTMDPIDRALYQAYYTWIEEKGFPIYTWKSKESSYKE